MVDLKVFLPALRFPSEMFSKHIRPHVLCNFTHDPDLTLDT